MLETIMAVVAAELGLIVLFAVGVFALEVYALHLRNKQPVLRLLSEEEILAHGLKDARSSTGSPKDPSGHYA